MDDLTLAKKYISKADNARSRGIKFDMTFTAYKNLMRAKKCFYTGVELSDVVGAAGQRTIDRINCNKGYEKGNVVACCLSFNGIKSTMERDGSIFNPLFKKAIMKMFDSVGTETKPTRAKKK